MNNEKLKVLEMIQGGKVNAQKGMEMLASIDQAHDYTSSKNPTRYFRVRVDGDQVKKVNVNIPLKLVKVFSKFAVFGMKYFPEQALKEMESNGIDLSKLNLEELVYLIEQGQLDNTLVDIKIDDPHEGKIQVQVYVD